MPRISSLFVALIILGALIHGTFSACHYSCSNCTTDLRYTRCYSCSNPDDSLLVLQNSSTTPSIYRHSLSDSGVCTAKLSEGTNILGVFILIFSIIGLALSRSYGAFFIVSTFQTVGLFGLLEVAWVEPLSYLLQAFQYLMPFNLILSSAKSDSYDLVWFGYYRLDGYMVSGEDLGLIGIFVLNIIFFVVSITLYVILYCRQQKDLAQKRQQSEGREQKSGHNDQHLLPQESFDADGNRFAASNEFVQKYNSPNQQEGKKKIIQIDSKTGEDQNFGQKEQESNLESSVEFGAAQEELPFHEKLYNSCTTYFFDEFLTVNTFLHLNLYILFFMAQQTALSIMVSAVFDIGTIDITIWVIYFVVVAGCMLMMFNLYEDSQKDRQKNGMRLFISRECMLFVWIKKILLPLGVVVPIDIQYMFFIFYVVLFVIEGGIDSKSGRFGCLSRMSLYKLIEMILLCLILSYYFNEYNGTSEDSANILALIAFLVGIMMTVILVVEVVFSFLLGRDGQNNGNKLENDGISHKTDESCKKNKRYQLPDHTQQTLENEDNIFDQKDQGKRDKEMEVIDLDEENDVRNDNQRKASSMHSSNGMHMAVMYKADKDEDDMQTVDRKGEDEDDSQQKANTGTRGQSKSEAVTMERKKKKKRRIEDPQLRKRYGMN